MKLTDSQKADILEKNNRLETIKPILKSEFIGIDNVIDSVLNAIRPFYIFPKSLKRPLVISLWGMTSCGKTCLVQRIVELLEMKNRFIRFDVGEYTGSDYKLRNELSDKTNGIKEPNVVICFDEFQFGRTIDEKGLELKSNAMRPVWDLLDSGKISKINYDNCRYFFDLLKLIEKAIKSGVEINDEGVVNKNINTYNSIFKHYSKRPCDYKNVNWKSLMNAVNAKDSGCENVQSEDELKEIDSSSDNFQGYSKDIVKKCFSEPYFFKRCWFDNALQDNDKNNFDFQTFFSTYCTNKTLEELHFSLKRDFLDSQSLMVDEDYSQSLIFCLGNIDEAYHMHESSDPDADADIFYEHSLKISIPKIKDALSKRFRMEQIGRLGNNHIIYSAFNKASYYKLIDLHLNRRINYFKEEFDIDLVFDKTIHELMYKEGVFPSQGVRPLLSTFNTVIDSYVSKIISDLILHSADVKKISWKFSFKKEKHIVKITDIPGGKSFEYEVKLTIDILRKTDYSEEQAFVAVHEAGHAVIGLVKGGFLPKEVVSRTASMSEGFCRIDWPDISTKELFYRQIMTALGGIEAEKLIFGDDMISAGASSDLRKATVIASQMVKVFGMNNRNYVTSTSISDMNEHSSIHDDGQSEIEVTNIIKKAEDEVKDCLSNNKLFLLEISEYLSNNSKMEKEQFKNIAVKFIDENEMNEKDSFYHFRDVITRLKAEEINKEKSEKGLSSKLHTAPEPWVLNKDEDNLNTDKIRKEL